jgi:hypothetical protein
MGLNEIRRILSELVRKELTASDSDDANTGDPNGPVRGLSGVIMANNYDK